MKMSVLADFNSTIERRRRDRQWLASDHKNKRREALWALREARKHRGVQFWREHDDAKRLADEARERQRLQDMCEDAGLVFCLPSLNPYSGE
jgi:hypothetical protein